MLLFVESSYYGGDLSGLSGPLRVGEQDVTSTTTYRWSLPSPVGRDNRRCTSAAPAITRDLHNRTPTNKTHRDSPSKRSGSSDIKVDPDRVKVEVNGRRSCTTSSRGGSSSMRHDEFSNASGKHSSVSQQNSRSTLISPKKEDKLRPNDEATKGDTKVEDRPREQLGSSSVEMISPPRRSASPSPHRSKRHTSLEQPAKRKSADSTVPALCTTASKNSADASSYTEAVTILSDSEIAVVDSTSCDVDDDGLNVDVESTDKKDDMRGESFYHNFIRARITCDFEASASELITTIRITLALRTLFISIIYN